MQFVPELRGQVRGGRLLEHFLVAALQRAVAVAQADHAALAVAEDLHFHVPGVFDVALGEHAGGAEARAGEPRHPVRSSGELVLAAAHGHADAAATAGGLEHQREADVPGGRTAASRSASRPEPAIMGTPARWAASRAVCLVPKIRSCSGVGPTKTSPAASTASANPRPRRGSRSRGGWRRRRWPRPRPRMASTRGRTPWPGRARAARLRRPAGRGGRRGPPRRTRPRSAARSSGRIR